MNSKKCLLAVLAGAVIVFVWLNISWMVLEWHGIKSVNDQEATGSALKAAAPEDGVYAVPAWKDKDGKMLEPDEMAKAAEAGPFAFMVILPDGKKMSMARSMITGFVIQIVGALLLCFLMLMVSGGSGSDFKRRVIVAVCFSLAAGLMPALSNWNWWHFPIGYTFATIADSLISWTLAGLAMARILK
jgi:hypothetical protein